MSLRRAAAPLTAGSTYLRWVFVILGGVLAIPYLGLTSLLGVYTFQGLLHPVAGVVFALITAVIGGAIAVIPAARALEAAAARALLDEPLEGVGPAHSRSARLRTLAYFVCHLSLGVAGWLILLIGLPAAVGLAMAPWVPGQGFTGDGPLPTGWVMAWAPPAGLLILLTLPYVGVGLGVILKLLARVLLGPSAGERLAAAEERALRLAERNRLARELHDSVGHALSVVTVQAGAAGRVLERDPDFVRRALQAIEDSGRTALADLDHVIGLLREEESTRSPQPTLADLDRLVAGLDADADIGATGGVPAAVSREAFRIVQEGLTNIRKHGDGGRATLRVAVHDDELELEMSNRMSEERDRPGEGLGGRGITGMRERVRVLHGTMTAGPHDGIWRVSVRLPLRAKKARP